MHLTLSYTVVVARHDNIVRRSYAREIGGEDNEVLECFFLLHQKFCGAELLFIVLLTFFVYNMDTNIWFSGRVQ